MKECIERKKAFMEVPHHSPSLTRFYSVYNGVPADIFCHRRANAMEQSAWTASATGHHLGTIQTIVENLYVWL